MRHYLQLFRHQFNPFRSFRAAIAITFGLSSIILALILSVLVSNSARNIIDENVTVQIQTLAQRLAYELETGMFERYQDVQVAASALEIAEDDLSLSQQRDSLHILQDSLPDYSWIGIANPDGDVRVSTQGVLEGVDVSARPWFINGSDGIFVGDVHGALLLEPYFSGSSSEPLRLVDIAVPLYDEAQNLTGVLGVHLNWEWAQKIHQALLTEELQEREIHLYILSENGRILAGSDDNNEETLLANLVDQLDTTQNTGMIANWDNDTPYLIGYAPSNGYRDYPGLGWQVVTTQPVAVAFQPANQLTKQIILIGFVIGMVFIVLGWIIATWTTRPLSKIVRVARTIQQGDDVANIPPLVSNVEVETLRDALQNMLNKLRQEMDTRRIAQDNLSQQKQLLSIILANIPLIIIELDEQQHIQFINDKGVALLGWQDDRFKHFEDLLIAMYPDATERQRIYNYLMTPDNDWQTVETRNQAQKTLYLSWLSVHLSGDHLLLIGLDLTEEKQREVELQANFALQQLLDNASQGVVIFKENDEIILVNQYVEALLDQSRDTLIGQSIDTLLPANIRPAQNESDTMTLHRSDNKTVAADVSLTPVEIEDQTYTMAFILDRSNREAKLDQEQEQLLQREKQQLVNELQSRFLQLISHEFRTPLAVINSSADIILRYFDRMDESKIREKLSSIQNQVNRIVEIMDKGLRQTRDNIHITNDQTQVIDVAAFCQEQIRLMRDTYAPTHTFVLHADEGTLYRDQELLGTIIINLLLNAANYSPNGSTITLKANHEDDLWFFAIQDQGMGINQDDLGLIFEPFFRTDSAGKIPGTGLGLTIVKRYVEYLDGRITIESTPHQGTTVTVTLASAIPATDRPSDQLRG